MTSFAGSAPLARLAALSFTLLLLGLLLPAAVVQGATSYDLEARYDVDLHLDWDTRRISVTTDIDLRNTSGEAVDRLELNTVAAKLGGLRDLRVKVDGSRVAAKTTGQTIKVPLGKTVPPGGSVDVRVAYKARLLTTSAARGYLFAKLDGVAQIYRFIPWLSRRIAFGASNHGEPFITPTSPRVVVTLSADRKLVWATSGRRVAKVDGKTSRFVATNVRDFNVAASPGWKTARTTSSDGRTKIVAYARRHDARRLVALAKEELARYQRITGVPYPYATYAIAESGGGPAMESPALDLDPGGPRGVRPPLSRLARDRPPVVVLDGGQRPVHRRLRRRGSGRLFLTQGAPLDPCLALSHGSARSRDPLVL